MNVYRVTVLKFGNVLVEAETEDEAKERVRKFLPDQIHWNDQNDRMPRFLVAYTEIVN